MLRNAGAGYAREWCIIEVTDSAGQFIYINGLLRVRNFPLYYSEVKKCTLTPIIEECERCSGPHIDSETMQIVYI